MDLVNSRPQFLRTAYHYLMDTQNVLFVFTNKFIQNISQYKIVMPGHYKCQTMAIENVCCDNEH